MNNQLLKKIITSNDLQCPNFTFENPLLDKNVAKVLSKSFVKMYKYTQENLKHKLRQSLLENIRKTCQIEPENHIKIDDNLTATLKEVYEQQPNTDETVDSIDKEIDAFLIRNLMNININSRYKPSVNPDIMQALNNLNEHEVKENTLLKDVIHWDCTDKKYIHILKSLWINEDCNNDDIYVKLKSELEGTLLETCINILSDMDNNIKEYFTSNSTLKKIVKESSVSANCFQICTSILNYIFINSDFNTKILLFIQKFVQHVKEKCSKETISVLYPIQINYIVTLLDIELEELPEPIQTKYKAMTVNYLSKIKYENDLIMLLSHYPKWFDIYFIS